MKRETHQQTVCLTIIHNTLSLFVFRLFALFFVLLSFVQTLSKLWKKIYKVSNMVNLVILQGLGIAFVVTRVNELNSFLGSKNKVWDTEAKWQLNCYRLLLIGAIMCSVCSLLACVFLAAASCMWGHKVRDLQINFTNWFKKNI